MQLSGNTHVAMMSRFSGNWLLSSNCPHLEFWEVWCIQTVDSRWHEHKFLVGSYSQYNCIDHRIQLQRCFPHRGWIVFVAEDKRFHSARPLEPGLLCLWWWNSSTNSLQVHGFWQDLHCWKPRAGVPPEKLQVLIDITSHAGKHWLSYFD